jgi:hypothetical protein
MPPTTVEAPTRPERAAARTARPVPSGSPSRRRRTLAWRGVHLAVLSAFGIAQPLFSEIDEGTYLIYFDPERIDLWVVTLAFILGPPLLLLAIEVLAGLRSRRVEDALHLCFVAGLAAIVASQAIVELWAPSSGAHALAAVAAGLGFAVLYAKAAPVRSVLSVLAPTPLLFAALFLFFSPVEKLAVAGEGDPPATPVKLPAPVVTIVFDELPATALMNAHGELDAARYPNFARLARQSTWFRNATTRHSLTQWAVPAVVTGRRPVTDSLPVASDHPRNLFAMVSGSPVTAEEPVTDLCPDYVCPNPRTAQTRTSDLLETLGLYSMRQWLPESLVRRLPAEREVVDEPSVYAARFMDSLRADRPDGLHYLHVMLPHAPFVYLPSGKRYAAASNATVVGLAGVDRWTQEPWSVVQAQQAYLLQLQYTDRVLGEVLDRLEQQGMFERSLIMVVADHGVSFRAGEYRRQVTPGNAEDILPVPFFVKAPGQRRGATSDAFVRNTDLMATLVDVLDLDSPWPVAGTSAFDRDESAGGQLEVSNRAGRPLVLSAQEFERRRDAALRRRVALFGSGRHSLFDIGPHQALVGRRPGRVETSERAAVNLTGSHRLDVDLSSPAIPAQVLGTILGPGAGAVDGVAIAVNGRIATTTRTFIDGGAPRFSALLPESVLRDGSNELGVYAISRDGGELRRLTLLPD